jgi:hypothetical protein
LIPKGQSGPLKAWVHSGRTKQMVMMIFYLLGLINMLIVPREEGAAISTT